MIEVKDLIYSYVSEDGTSEEVLKNVSLNIKQGEFVAVLGHNGSGKSTFAKHLNAIFLPMGGKVYVGGIDTADESRLWDVRGKVGMVFQNPDNQIVASIVEEDVAFAPENLGIEPAEIRRRVDDALEKVGMSEYKKHSPHMLSGGQKQRVAIAGIIAMKPEIIVMDEPTAMLDPIGRREVIQTIEDLNSLYGITIVLITHNMDEAVKAQRVVVIDSGKVIMDDTARNVFKNVELLREVGLDVPQATLLAWELRKKGYNIRDDVLTVDECTEEIYKLCR
ncbi:MAG: energy-coupling factor transporter ATPase [Ruminococcaceae bacterium]|nr:energy-coupling factor transporter ATPase [Oscillospiraceae bacterium]